MRTVSPESLKGMSIRAEVIDTYISEWRKGDRFNKYQKVKRPFSALFFVMSDMELDYVEISESGEHICTTHASKGDILYLPANILYHVVFKVKDRSALPTTFTVNFRLFDADGEELLLDRHVLLLKNQVNRYMSEDLINLHRCMTNPIAHDRMRINSIYFSILYYATRVRTGGSHTDDIKRAVQAIENEWNLNEKMEKYAALCNMSPSYFYREFREYAGMSPAKYRNYIRINVAKSDLLNTNMTVKEIAEKVGFDDALYFSRIFSSIAGMSPTAFKREMDAVRAQKFK
jgi:AraC-like DNA-binding protein